MQQTLDLTGLSFYLKALVMLAPDTYFPLNACIQGISLARLHA